MEYFKINYSKLENLHQIKFYKIVIFMLVVFSFLIIISCFTYTTKKLNFNGYYNEGKLYLKINNKLSDIVKDNKRLIFNNKKVSYEIIKFGEYEIIDENIYQEIELTIDREFLNNEVGTIEINYDKERIIEYIFELFK